MAALSVCLEGVMKCSRDCVNDEAVADEAAAVEGAEAEVADPS